MFYGQISQERVPCQSPGFGTQVALLKSLATDEPSKESQETKEHDNEAGNQDCDSDGSDGRYLYRSKHSADFSRRRRPSSFVPTPAAKLLDGHPTELDICGRI
jgi:hypothetical protein